VVDGSAKAPPPAPVAVVTPDPAPAPPPACTLSRVHFAFDSAQLDDESRDALKVAAACLQQKQPADVVIEGHCDERGTVAYNVALGNRRASAVKAYLADLGVKAPMEPISFGEELPLVKGEGEATWSQNRRAELRLPGERRTDGTVVAGR
jgi:peptidoglycan-associated lipoprotein